MENCLVTKLKSVVENNNLKKIDEVIFDLSLFSRNTIINIRARSGENFTVRALTGYFMKSENGSQETEFTGTEVNIFASGEAAKLSVRSKYVLDRVNGWQNGFVLKDINLNDWAFLSMDALYLKGQFVPSGVKVANSRVVTIYEETGNNLSSTIKNISEELARKTSVTEFNFSNDSEECKVTGNISDFSAEVVARLVGLKLNAPTITGTMASLGKFYSCNSFNVIRSHITGSIEDFVNAQIAAGRTEVLASAPVYFNQITKWPFNGNIYNISRDSLIEWNSNASRIIVYTNGNGYTVNDHPYVYAYGASAQEIAAWQSVGKTVTDVVSGTVYPPTN